MNDYQSPLQSSLSSSLSSQHWIFKARENVTSTQQTQTSSSHPYARTPSSSPWIIDNAAPSWQYSLTSTSVLRRLDDPNGRWKNQGNGNQRITNQLILFLRVLAPLRKEKRSGWEPRKRGFDSSETSQSNPLVPAVSSRLERPGLSL